MVDRYGCFVGANDYQKMAAADDGAWVKYSDYETLEAKLADKEKTVELHRKRADAYRNEALNAKFDRCAKVIEESIASGKYSQDNRVKLLEAKLARLVDEVQDVINRGEVFDAKGTHSKWVCDKLKAAIYYCKKEK